MLQKINPVENIAVLMYRCILAVLAVSWAVHVLDGLCIRRMRTQTLCIWWTLCRHVTIGTPMVIFAVLTVF